MLERLELRCESCDAALDDAHRQLTIATGGGTRHAYECDCGCVTIAVGLAEAG
ncbi:MAG: hypothetical protein ABEJ42_01690 [Halobacteriaceae archaeon]